MSIHGVSRPGCGSQALPTNTATFALGASVNPASLKRSPTPGNADAAAPVLARCQSVVSMCVLPPPICVTSVCTGAVFSVLPARRRSTRPELSRSARVKQVREKNCSGFL